MMEKNDKQPTQVPEFLTVSDLSQRLKVSPRWIHEQIRDGGLPAHYLGRSGRILRFRSDEVEEWVRSFSSPTIETGGSNGEGS